MAEQLYIARRAFKAGGQFYAAGSLIEDPSSIKLFKIRVSDNIIVPVPDKADAKKYDALKDFMWERFKVDLDKLLDSRNSRGPEVAEPESASTPTTGTKPASAEKTDSASTPAPTTIAKPSAPGKVVTTPAANTVK